MKDKDEEMMERSESVSPFLCQLFGLLLTLLLLSIL